MKKNKLQWIGLCIFALAGFQASAQVAFSPISVNLSFPQFQRLKMDGGYVYMDDAGMRGIIVYHVGENSFLAYDRACPYHPDAPCAQVQVDLSGLFLIERCCKSNFDFSNGQPTGGPCTRALFQYRIEIVNDTNFKITDEIIN